MNVLFLCVNGRPEREIPLTGAALEVGSGIGCDIVINEREVRARHALVQEQGAAVLVHELSDDGARPRSTTVLVPNEPWVIGRWHSIVRVPDIPTRPRPITNVTEPLERDSSSPRMSLIVGRGTDARRVALSGFALSIGSSPGADVRIPDRTVSSLHCRLESSGGDWMVRDLGSRNGTIIDGVEVQLARVGPGSVIRLGRTDLRLVAREPSEGRRSGLVARSPGMIEAMDRAEHYAHLSEPILILGESGAGKEGIARSVHLSGPRASGPYVAINAGGMPRSLIESELFGHERGAFTGASGQRLGVFEQAHGGTLFLDEIGELPLDLQARLLRVLDTMEVRRIGSDRDVRVDFRLVCATHRDLRRMVAEGELRNDLYHRIAVLMIHVPPLRDRPEDIPALAEHFLARSERPRPLAQQAIARLLTHDWPGNARELRNIIARAAASSAGATLSAEDIEGAFRDAGIPLVDGEPTDKQLERVLEMHRGNLTAAARALGIPRTTLRDRVRSAQARARSKRSEE